MRPLAAISGRVRVAGVVSRLRALVSCSITASISWGGELVTAGAGAAPSGGIKLWELPIPSLGVTDSGPEPLQHGLLKMRVIGLQLGVGAGHLCC